MWRGEWPDEAEAVAAPEAGGASAAGGAPSWEPDPKTEAHELTREGRGMFVATIAWQSGRPMAVRMGQGLVEYALIILLIAIGVFVALSLVAPQLNNVFSRITASLGG
jgi:Flp pilus assembly pilin Flp